MLEHVSVLGVRNLARVDVDLSEGATALFGANGSGKTSFLEAIHLLGTGRSFRARHAKSIIQHSHATCRVVGKIRRGARSQSVGVEKDRDAGLRARIGGENVSSMSELAQALPIVLLDTDSISLLTGAPEGRRRLLDGTLFHVEQGFLALWRRYIQAVRQRNGGLRHGILDADSAWRRQLAEAGELLTAHRAQMAEKLSDRLAVLAASLSGDLADVSVQFRRGWDRSLDLAEALERSGQRDAAQGFTQVGPHRADLRVMVGDMLAADILSRGQMKLLLVALKLVQGRLIEESGPTRPLYLVDDLPAELDAAHCASVCRELGVNRQVVLTAVDRTALETAWQAGPLSLFHVEHGRVAPHH
jgi:DNA replication and repair protein RecF